MRDSTIIRSMQFESSINSLSKSCSQIEGVDLGQKPPGASISNQNFITDVVHQIDKEHSVPIKDSKFLQDGKNVKFINGEC